MKVRCMALFCTLALVGFVSAIEPAAEKDAPTKDKLVGTWEVVKSATDLPEGSTVEFTKDGKLKIVVKAPDKEVKLDGTYTMDGDKVVVNTKFGDLEHKETIKIKTLTDKELVTVDEKGKEDSFKKKK